MIFSVKVREVNGKWTAVQLLEQEVRETAPTTVSCNSWERQVSDFLKLRPFNTVPHVVVTPNHKSISLLLHNCNFATLMNCNVNPDMHNI